MPHVKTAMVKEIADDAAVSFGHHAVEPPIRAGAPSYDVFGMKRWWRDAFICGERGGELGHS
jgi:hypothetical protein